MFRFSRFALLSVLFGSGVPLQAQNFPSSLSISSPTRIVGPAGVRREAGSWLFNDSIFVSPGENVVAPNSPVFIPNLRRDKKNKLPVFMPAAARGPLRFATLPLPTFFEMMQPTFDFAGLPLRLTAQVNAAKAAGRVYVGFELQFGEIGNGGATAAPTKDQILATLKRLRAALDGVAPDAALVLSANHSLEPLQAVAEIDELAPLCDAVIIEADLSRRDNLWPLKMARRVAEEQKDYDLPIFISATAPVGDPRAWESSLLELFMGGATGFILPDDQTPRWAAAINRNAGLFTQAVTLEDAAILPSLSPQTLQIGEDLRAVGRVPLVGRLPGNGRNGEALIANLDAQVSLETLRGLDQAARNGATIYLEGVPDLSNKAIFTLMGDMTSCTIEILPVPKPEILSLDDPWLFGDARGQELAVTQRIKWTPKTTLAAQTRVKKGEPSPLPFSSARLAGDANGFLNAPLGKGRVLWLAHLPTPGKSSDTARRALLSAIAGNLQGALASWKFASVEDEMRNGGHLHLALRASKTGTPIIAVFNAADTDAPISLSERGDAALALDLSDEKEVKTSVVGYSATLPVTVPAHGFRWFAFGPTRAALDKERLAPRPKAKTR